MKDENWNKNMIKNDDQNLKETKLTNIILGHILKITIHGLGWNPGLTFTEGREWNSPHPTQEYPHLPSSSNSYRWICHLFWWLQWWSQQIFCLICFRDGILLLLLKIFLVIMVAIFIGDQLRSKFVQSFLALEENWMLVFRILNV